MKKIVDFIGSVLFKYRSLSPLPLLFVIFLLFNPVDLKEKNILLIIFSIIFVIGGEIIRALVVGFSKAGTSGREAFFRADSINVTGLYSIVRNPLYIGNLLIYNGLMFLVFRWEVFLLVNVYFFFQYHFIILSEEQYLEKIYKKEYVTYKNKINKIFPSLKFYQRNENCFNWKKFIFKETDSVFNVMALYIGFLIYRELSIFNSIRAPLPMILVGSMIVITYVIIKIIKKKQKSKIQ